jgi:hypothetical protein
MRSVIWPFYSRPEGKRVRVLLPPIPAVIKERFMYGEIAHIRKHVIEKVLAKQDDSFDADKLTVCPTSSG